MARSASIRLAPRSGRASVAGTRRVGTDASHDVALVKINDSHGAKALTLGDTKNLRVGDEVLAIGNALDLGDSPTVTLGIVSAKNRSIDTNTEHLDGLLQTDAAINPGNSGGPLMNANGEVVGINTAGVPGANNIGFAIDINSVKPLVDQLKQGKGNPATTAFLGVASVSVSDLPANTKTQLGITGNTGVLVQQVTTGSAAAQAGVQPGDVILKVDGKDIADTNALRDAIQAKKPGDKMTLTVQRKGQSKTIDVTLGSRASQNS